MRKKKKYIIFGNGMQLQDKPDLNLTIRTNKIEWVFTFKYLGVLLDKYLTFNDHIDFAVSKASMKLVILRKSREYLDRKTAVFLYKSLVLPLMDYCSLVYTNTNEANLNRLQLVQNAACRTILQLKSVKCYPGG